MGKKTKLPFEGRTSYQDTFTKYDVKHTRVRSNLKNSLCIATNPEILSSRDNPVTKK